MILCLDAGNSRLKWGLWDGAAWHAHGATAHDDAPTLSLPASPRRILACNVAGSDAAAHIEALAVSLCAPLVWFRSTAAAAGVRNGYDRPTQLGADRWAALIGAHGLHAGPALVVMAGTATTIDVLDAAGSFLGGLILPGLDLMRRALAQNTANLPEASGHYRDMPRTTDDAIVSGCLAATLGAIERMAARVPRRAAAPTKGIPVGQADFCCLLSGGAAPLLAPHLALPCRLIDNLVLEGLARYDAMQQPTPDDLL